MRLHHIGYAVRNINDAAEYFISLGYEPCGNEVDDFERGVKICFFRDRNGAKIELIAPLRDDSPVSLWLKKNGCSPYHLCYESSDIEQDLLTLNNKGFRVAVPMSPAPAVNGRRVVFLYNPHIGLIELIEG